MVFTVDFSSSLVQLESTSSGAIGISAPASSPFNIWLDGTLMVYNQKETGNTWGNFTLVSAGVDYLLSEKALLGLSFHYDRMADPTNENALLTGDGWLAGPYASLEIGKGVFRDTSQLYGGSFNAIGLQSWNGTFDTSRWLFDTSLAGQCIIDDVTVLTPRAVYISETVNDYSVDAYMLDFQGFTKSQLRVSLGAEIARQYTLENGMVLTPTIGATAGFSGRGAPAHSARS